MDLMQELNGGKKVEVVETQPQVKQQVTAEQANVANDVFGGFTNQLNDNKVFEKEFNEIADGEYLTIVNQLTIKLSQKGKPLVSVVYQVVDGNENGRNIWDTIWLTNREGKLSLGNLVELFQNIFGSDKEKTIKAVRELLIKFDNDGHKDLALSVESNSLPQNKTGVLTVKTREWTSKAGVNGTTTYKKWKPNA